MQTAQTRKQVLAYLMKDPTQEAHNSSETGMTRDSMSILMVLLGRILWW